MKGNTIFLVWLASVLILQWSSADVLGNNSVRSESAEYFTTIERFAFTCAAFRTCTTNPGIKACKEPRDMINNDEDSNSELNRFGGEVVWPRPLNPKDDFRKHQTTGYAARYSKEAIAKVEYPKSYPYSNQAPGWNSLVNPSRDHWHGRQYGGSGLWKANIVAFEQSANSNMQGFECDIGDAWDLLDLTAHSEVYASAFGVFGNDMSPVLYQVQYIYAFIQYSTDSGNFFLIKPWKAMWTMNEVNAEPKTIYDTTDDIKRMFKNTKNINVKPTYFRSGQNLHWLDFYPGMKPGSSSSSWAYGRHPSGPEATFDKAKVKITTERQTIANRAVILRSRFGYSKDKGFALHFRLKMQRTNAGNIELRFNGGLILRFQEQGKSAEWGHRKDGGWTKLGNSKLRFNGIWSDVFISYLGGKYRVYERGQFRGIIWKTSVNDKFRLFTQIVISTANSDTAFEMSNWLFMGQVNAPLQFK